MTNHYSETLLPSGYEPVLGHEIAGQEVIDLHKIVIEDSVSDDDTAEEMDAWIKDALGVVGVRAATKELVGVGFLFGDEESAYLEWLAVHLDHQHQGIGRFLIKRRVEIAQELGITDIQTGLIDTNSLRSYYEALGVLVQTDE